MANVWVSTTGLHALTTVFDEQAAQVASTGAIPPVNGGFTASAAAVQSVHGHVEQAAAKVADRLRATGALVEEARAGYEGTDAANAALIGSVASGLSTRGGR